MGRVSSFGTNRYASGANCLAGSVTLPQGSLYAGASGGYQLLEAGIFVNSATSAAKRFLIQRMTSRGTPGTAITEGKYRAKSPAAHSEAFETHTVAPTLGDVIHPAPGTSSAAQSGFYQGFYDWGVEVPAGTANGVGMVVISSTGNADVTWVWEE